MDYDHPFWRADEPLTGPERELVTAVLEAHALSVYRHNVSSAAVVECATGSADYVKGIAAALMSIGGPHAPLAWTSAFLGNSDVRAATREALGKGFRVPGWGNSFEKGHKDPIWAEVDGIIAANFPDMAAKLNAVTEELHAVGKDIFPNPSAYTAATAIIVGLPGPMSYFLLIEGRLENWTRLIWRSSYGG